MSEIDWKQAYFTTHDNLLRYGDHDVSCKHDDDGGESCNCGFSDALALFHQERTTQLAVEEPVKQCKCPVTEHEHYCPSWGI